MKGMKGSIEKSVYQVLLDVYKLVLDSDLEEKRDLAMIYFSEAVKNIAMVLEMLKLNSDEIRKLVYSLKVLKDE